MNFYDNMGGIISVDFILQEDIEYFAVFGDRCTLKLKNNREWKHLKSKKEGITISITSENTDAGLLYSVKGSVILKKESEYLNVMRLSPSVLVRYKTVDGIYRIIGTEEYTLTALLDSLTPAKASSFYGYELSLSGKQTNPPLFLDI